MDNKIPQIGITGGIGSGKTTVCNIFEYFSIPVYYADDRAKYLMTNDTDLVEAIKESFGEDAYFGDGSLNRAYLGNIVFSNPKKLKILNGLVHPAVHKDGAMWHSLQRDVPYTLNEAALMVESGGYKRMDKLIVVTAPEDLRIERVMKRDKTTAEAVRARMNNQLSEEEKVLHADHVIYNDGSHSLIEQVFIIHRRLSS